MNKKCCALLGMHIVAIAGISAGYIRMYQKLQEKKPKKIDLD